MKNRIVMTVLLLFILATFTACGDGGIEVPELGNFDATNSIELLEHVYESEFIEFKIPKEWSILFEDALSVTITPPNDDGVISSVSIQFIETGGVINAKQYMDATLSGISGAQLTTIGVNSNNVIFLKITGSIPGSDMNSYIWQYTTDTDDGNIIRISVSGVPEQNGILDNLLDSIKVLK